MNRLRLWWSRLVRWAVWAVVVLGVAGCAQSTSRCVKSHTVLMPQSMLVGKIVTTRLVPVQRCDLRIRVDTLTHKDIPGSEYTP